MVKISVGGYDDGEGPSNPTQKRRRVSVPNANVGEDQPQGFEFEIEDPSGTEEERENNDGAEHHASDDEEHDSADDGYDESVGFGPGSNANSTHNIGSATDDRDKALSVILTDPDVLDCCICYEPLCVPVFQCENGHIACSNCCSRLGNKCPMCSMPIGYNRCRAMEKVLESIKLSCLNSKYGCKETFSYSKKNDHEKECNYVPCLCPHSGCDFVASSKELSLHFSNGHVGSGIQFIYEQFFSVFLNINQKSIVLQEKIDANLFILHNNLELLGNIVHLSCIGPKSKAGFHYDILARSQGSSLILQSHTKNIQGRFTDIPSIGFLLIPSDYFGTGQLKLDIRIKYNAAHRS